MDTGANIRDGGHGKNGRKRIARVVRRGVYVLLALAVVTLVVLAYRPKPLPVDIATVERGDLVVTLREEGKTRLRDRYVVSAPVSAKVLRVELQAGDDVKAGQVVARLLPMAAPLLDERTDAQARAQVAAARSTRSQAGALVQRLRTELGYAERDAQRKRGLAEQGAISDNALSLVELKLDTLREELRSAELGVQVASHELQVALAAQQGTDAVAAEEAPALSLTSPVTGRILHVHQESQATVPAGAALLDVGDCSELQVEVDVLTADAVSIELGTKARFTRWGGDEALHGHVVRVEPSAFTRVSSLGIEEQRVRLLLDLDSPYQQWRALGDGFRVEAELVLRELKNITRVPLGAVFREGPNWAVYRVEGGVAKLTPLTAGARTDAFVEVDSGLAPGQSVVLYPSERLNDGQEVVTR